MLTPETAVPAIALERKCLHRKSQELGKHTVDEKEVLGEGRWEAQGTMPPCLL